MQKIQVFEELTGLLAKLFQIIIEQKQGPYPIWDPTKEELVVLRNTDDRNEALRQVCVYVYHKNVGMSEHTEELSYSIDGYIEPMSDEGVWNLLRPILNKESSPGFDEMLAKMENPKKNDPKPGKGPDPTAEPKKDSAKHPVPPKKQDDLGDVVIKSSQRLRDTMKESIENTKRIIESNPRAIPVNTTVIPVNTTVIPVNTAKIPMAQMKKGPNTNREKNLAIIGFSLDIDVVPNKEGVYGHIDAGISDNCFAISTCEGHTIEMRFSKRLSTAGELAIEHDQTDVIAIMKVLHRMLVKDICSLDKYLDRDILIPVISETRNEEGKLFCLVLQRQKNKWILTKKSIDHQWFAGVYVAKLKQ